MLVLVGSHHIPADPLTPGDPASVVAGDNASLEAHRGSTPSAGSRSTFPGAVLALARHGCLHGDLGTSFTSGKPVTELILDRMPITLSLTTGATLDRAADRHAAWRVCRDAAWFLGRPDDDLRTSLGIAAPEFFIGLLLVLLIALELGWLPATGYVPFIEDPLEYFARLILPSLTLGLGVAAE